VWMSWAKKAGWDERIPARPSSKPKNSKDKKIQVK
jgi:hypothetical protein